MEGLIVDISSALAKNGAIVYIVGRRKEKLDMAVKMHESVFPIYMSTNGSISKEK